MKFLNAHQQGGQVIIYGKQTNARINYTANIHVFDLNCCLHYKNDFGMCTSTLNWYIVSHNF